MRRGALAAVAASLLGLLLAPGAGASHDPSGEPFGEDFALGFGRGQDFQGVPLYEFEFDVRSGPSGENPTGSFSVGTLFGVFHIAATVTCLTVRDDDPTTTGAATIGFSNGHSQNLTAPRNAYAIASPGILTFSAELPEPPQSCPPPADVDAQGPDFAGQIVVHDAQPFPTAKDQCKHGGWRNFPGLKNQGECVAFVERHPQP